MELENRKVDPKLVPSGIKELKEFQDDHLQFLKKELMKSGSFPGMAFVATLNSLVPPELMKSTKHLHGEISNEMQKVMLAVNMDITWKEAYHILHAIFSTQANPVVASLFGKIIEDFKKEFNGEDPANHASEFMPNVLKSAGLDIKDVAALGLKWMIKKTEAYGYLHFTEAWVSSMKAAHKKGSEESKAELDKFLKAGPIRERPGRREAIISTLECRDYQRMVILPYERDVPDTGKVLRFLDDEVVDSESITETHITGKFGGILSKMPTTADLA